FCKRYRSSYETPSPSSSSALLVQKRYRGTSELVLDTDSEGNELGEENTEEYESSDADDERESQGLDDEGQGLDEEGQGLEDEGPGMEEEEATPEGQQHAVLVVDTSANEPLGLGYGAARRRALESTEEIEPSTYEVGQSSRSMPEQEGAERVSALRQPTLVTWVDPEDGRVYTDIPTNVLLAAPVQTSPSPKWSLGSLLVSPSSLVVSSPIASLVATPAATISSLDALPPALFEDHDRDLRELYTRSWAVRDEIFSQRYRFLEREQKRATVTFSAIWRLILALEAWACQTDAQRAALWHAIYDIQRDNQDLRRQLAEERRERLKLTDRVARMERRQESEGE
ncbi:hypothetical protein Tco_1333020, partial [Tanacetum coccineum]